MEKSPCGKNIRRYREAIGMSQVDLAKKMGITTALLWKYESGTITNIPSDNVLKASEALCVSVNALFDREKNLDKSAADLIADKLLSDDRLLEHVKILADLPDNKKECVYSIIDTISKTTSF